jgi:hypothetical protein
MLLGLEEGDIKLHNLQQDECNQGDGGDRKETDSEEADHVHENPFSLAQSPLKTT